MRVPTTRRRSGKGPRLTFPLARSHTARIGVGWCRPIGSRHGVAAGGAGGIGSRQVIGVGWCGPKGIVFARCWRPCPCPAGASWCDGSAPGLLVRRALGVPFCHASPTRPPQSGVNKGWRADRRSSERAIGWPATPNHSTTNRREGFGSLTLWEVAPWPQHQLMTTALIDRDHLMRFNGADQFTTLRSQITPNETRPSRWHLRTSRFA